MLWKFYKKIAAPKNVIFLIISILFLIFLFNIPDIALVFFSSFVIASSLNPMVDKIVDKHNLSRKTASILVLSATFAVILGFLIPVIILSGQEIKSFAVSFPEYIDSIDDRLIANFPFLKDLFMKPVDMNNLFTALSGYASQYLDNVVDIGKNVGSALVYMIISVMFIFFFMADKSTIKETCLKLFPSQMRKRTGEIYDIIAHRIGGYVAAQILTMSSVGIVMGIGLTIIGVKYALLLALIATVLDIVPVIGPGIAIVICCVTTYELGTNILIAVIVIFALATIIENQFVRPYVFGKFMDIHPIIIYLFLFISAKFLGVLGVVFAPAIAATVCVLIQELYMKSLE